MYINNDRVSVIMPYWRYNEDSIKYLKESLQSLEDQTYKNFELILCIDSPDKFTVEEVKDVISKFSFKIDLIIRKSDKPNIASTRNEVLGYAITKWIAFLDADNIWNKYWLSYMVDSAKKVYPDVVYSSAASNKRPLEYDENMLKELNMKHDSAHDIIVENHFKYYMNCPANPLFGTVLLHNDALDKIGNFDPELEIYETSLMMVKLFMNYKIHYVKEAYLYTRVWEGAISTRGIHQKLVNCRKLFQEKSEEYFNEIMQRNVKELQEKFNEPK